jgi:NADPH-dependent 2,4-dienoyl-CoA reductase/sulfur reductase-like enzyme
VVWWAIRDCVGGEAFRSKESPPHTQTPQHTRTHTHTHTHTSHQIPPPHPHPPQIVVVGGGYIGAEVAAGLSLWGAPVTLAFPDGRLMARVLPPELAAFYERWGGVGAWVEYGV